MLFVQSAYWDSFEPSNYVDVAQTRVLKCPTFYFTGFHPDVIIQDNNGWAVRSAGGIYNSSLILYGFCKGLEVEQVCALFTEEVYNHLGFWEHWRVSREKVIADLDSCWLPGATMFDDWLRREKVFAYTPNHPKGVVCKSIVEGLLKRHGIVPVDRDMGDVMPDILFYHGVWPIYPDVALGSFGGTVRGSLDFCFKGEGWSMRDAFSLREFIELSYERYREQEVSFERIDALRENPDLYRDLESLILRPTAYRGNAFYGQFLRDSRSLQAKPQAAHAANARISTEANRAVKVVCDEELLASA